MPLEIVAEIAQGFEGKPEQAMLLLASAARAGADAAKFQIVYADELATREYKYYSLFSRLEMEDAAWKELVVGAERLGVKLYCDVYGDRSLRLAERLGVQTIKLHSTDGRNTALIEAIAASQIPRLMIGVGGAEAQEVDAILARIKGKRVVLMHGFQGYPTPLHENQIARIRMLRARYEGVDGLELGFADHVPDEPQLKLSLALVAIGAGATVIEKHLTLANVLKLEDHEAALNPDEFLSFVRLVRQGWEALGDGSVTRQWKLGQSEEAYRVMTRKHVVASQDLRAGERIESRMVGLKRTPHPDPIQDVGEVLGLELRRSVRKDDPIIWDDLNERADGKEKRA